MPPMPTTGDVRIDFILWDSSVSGGRSGEYVAITKYSGQTVQMHGWRLTDSGPEHRYRFPDFVLQLGATV